MLVHIWSLAVLSRYQPTMRICIDVKPFLKAKLILSTAVTPSVSTFLTPVERESMEEITN